jgi:hypothetical protein
MPIDFEPEDENTKIDFEPIDFEPETNQEENRGYVTPVLDLAKRAGSGVIDTAKGIGEMITSPLQTAKFIGQGVVDTAKEIPDLVTKTIPEAAEGAVLAGKDIVKNPSLAGEALYSGLLQNIPLTTAAPAYDLALQRAKAQGKSGITGQELGQAYSDISKQREASIEKSPLAGTLGEIAGMAGTFPVAKKTGKLAEGVVKAIDEVPSNLTGKLSKAGEKLEKSGQEAAVRSLKPTKNQKLKQEDINPELGKFLQDNEYVTAKDTLTSTKEKIENGLDKANKDLNDIYEKIDTATGGNTVDIKSIIAGLEKRKSELGRVHTKDLAKKAIDDEIETLRSVYGEDGFISANEAREIKRDYGKKAYRGEALPTNMDREMAADLSKIYRKSIEDSVGSKISPELRDSWIQANKVDSNLVSAQKMLEGKETAGISPWTIFAGTAGGAIHPMGVAAAGAAHLAKTRGLQLAASGERVLGKLLQKAPELQAKFSALNPAKQVLVGRLVEKGIELGQALNMVNKDQEQQ